MDRSCPPPREPLSQLKRRDQRREREQRDRFRSSPRQSLREAQDLRFWKPPCPEQTFPRPQRDDYPQRRREPSDRSLQLEPPTWRHYTELLQR